MVTVYFYIQYSSHPSWHLNAVNTHVFFNFCHDLSQNTRVTQNGLHKSQLSCTVSELVCCTRVIICVLHDSMKSVSNASCAARKLVFLCTKCKLTAIFCHRRIKANKKKYPTQHNVIKHVDMKKIGIYLPVFQSTPRWHFHWTNWMPSTIMAQGLDSTGTNDLTRLVAQCACVLYHKAQFRNLNWGASTTFLLANTMLSLSTIS